MRIPKKLLVVLCSVALIMSLVPMTALAATAYNSSIVSNTIPATMTTGQVVYAKVVVKNTGANTWTKARGIQLKEIDSLKLLPYAYGLSASASIKANQSNTFTVKITAPAKAGTYSLKLRMYRNGTAFGATLTKTIVVKSAVKTLASIAVTTQPTKTSYVIGEALDISGMVVTGTYSDGSKAAVTVTASNVTGYSKDTAGEQTLTVTFNGKTATFKVTVKKPGVDSVACVNGKTVKITFNKALDASKVVSSGKLIAANIYFTPIGAPAINNAMAAASLSSDGKTLTIVPQLAEYFGGNYAVTVLPAVLDKDGDPITAYSAVHSLSDSIRPTVVSVTYPNNGVARVTFSEPINAAAGDIVTASTVTGPADAAAETLTGRVSMGTDSFDIDMLLATAFTKDKNYSISLVGLKDFAGNLISPNPSTVTVKNSDVDSTVPTVLKVEPLDIGIVKVTFSEPIKSFGTINGVTIDTVTTPNATVDSTGTVLTTNALTTASPLLSGLSYVTIQNFTDKSGLTGTAWKGFVNFVTDDKAPVYVSHSVATIGTELYLLVKYNENVQIVADTSATTTDNALDAGTYLDGSMITKASPAVLALAANVDLYKPVSGKSDTIQIKITPFTANAGKYTVNISANLVGDLKSPTPNTQTNTKSVTFDVGGKPADTTVPKPTVGTVQTAKTIDTVVIDWNTDVTYATACNVAYYTVEGQQVFESAFFDGTARKVELKLKANSIPSTGDRTIEIKNVVSTAGVKMADFTDQKPFVKNIKPTMVSATFNGDKGHIDVTFSASLTGSAAEFEVWVNNVKLTTGVTAPVLGTAGTAYSITIPTLTVDDLAKSYVVKYVGSSFKDTATLGNYMAAGEVAVR